MNYRNHRKSQFIEKEKFSLVDFLELKQLEKEREIQDLNSKIQKLKADILAIEKSLTFRIGLFITKPFRWMIELINPQKKATNPIHATCDTAYFAYKTLEIKGWALSPNEINKIEVFNNNKLMGLCELNLVRDDVYNVFPNIQESLNSGFYFKGKYENINKVILIKITDNKSNIVEIEKVILPSFTSLSLSTQYQILLNQQKERSKNNLIKNKEFINDSTLISIIVPVYNVDPKWLNKCIESVQNQAYQNWQLCIYDDASNSQETKECLISWKGKDERIDIQFGKVNQGISLASNEAIKMAKGEFVALLDHDDELTSDALYEVVKCLNENPELDFIYSDEDKIEADGSLSDPHFKTDFNLETLLCWNNICHFSVIRKSIGDQVAWFRKGFEGSQDYDLFLRVSSKTKNIHHIAKVLYHWRKIDGSTAVSLENKDYALEASQRALVDYLEINNVKGSVEPGLFANSFRVRPFLAEDALVSIVIPFRDEPELLKSCVESVLNKTTFTHYELLLVDNQSTDSGVVDYCEELSGKYSNIRYLKFDEEFNYSKINNWAVQQTEGEFVLFLNNDIEVINKDWLEALLEPIQSNEVAAVGAKLLYEDDTIQHAGIVVNQSSAIHVNKGLKDGENGYFERTNYIQSVSACTAACLLVKKEVFLELGGFDEELFKIAYNDVDLCLKMRQAGYLITYTPYAKLYHYESKSRGLDSEPEKLERFTQEIKHYQDKWGEIYKDGDPYFNPNLLPSSGKIMLNIKQ